MTMKNTSSKYYFGNKLLPKVIRFDKICFSNKKMFVLHDENLSNIDEYNHQDDHDNAYSSNKLQSVKVLEGNKYWKCLHYLSNQTEKNYSKNVKKFPEFHHQHDYHHYHDYQHHEHFQKQKQDDQQNHGECNSKLSDNMKRIISYGGNQSNALLALAQLCCLKRDECLQLEYFTTKLKLKNGSLSYSGNRKLINEKYAAFVRFHEFEDRLELKQKIDDLELEYRSGNHDNSDVIFIRQGIAQYEAMFGIEKLSQIIHYFCEQNQLIEGNHHGSSSLSHVPIYCVLPSGTGTTSYCLARSLSSISQQYQVVTVPLYHPSKQSFIGEINRNHSHQMEDTFSIPNNLHIVMDENQMYPKRFAKPCKHYFKLHDQFLQESDGIVLDYIYAPKTLLLSLPYIDQKQSSKAEGRYHVLYIHTGGTTSNESVIERMKSNKI